MSGKRPCLPGRYLIPDVLPALGFINPTGIKSIAYHTEFSALFPMKALQVEPLQVGSGKVETSNHELPYYSIYMLR
jgi:hypothetical protein